MCPDPQILSIYLDGELPSPWKEKLQVHLTQCEKCKEKLDNLNRIQNLLKNDSTADESVKERVWSKLEACKTGAAPHYSRIQSQTGYSLWRRRLSIPVPAAAAAALVIAFLSVFYFMGSGSQASDPARANITIAADVEKIEEIPGIIPASNMNDVLQYLSLDGSSIIILQLPESQNFLRSGDPAIVRAADFSRNTVPRRQP